MMNATKKLGQYGESLAKRFLEQKGYHILSTNWQFRHLELDIIAKQGEQLVFVEVKTRNSNDMGAPEEAVSLMKQRKIVQAAHHYIEENEFDGDSRFDIVAISKENGAFTIKHLESAFFPLIK